MLEYPNANQPNGIGLAVVGGYVYRGNSLPMLRGQYIFGDWSRSFGQPRGQLFVARQRRSGMWAMRRLQIPSTPSRLLGHYLLGFGQDRSGEVYVLTSDTPGPIGETGKVFRLAAPTGRTGTRG